MKLTIKKEQMRQNQKSLDGFARYLREQERAPATVDKYIRDVRRFHQWIGKQKITRDNILKYKKYVSNVYKPTSVNSMIASLNKYFDYYNRNDLKIKTIKIQRKSFSSKEKELTREEYHRLMNASKKNERLSLVIETICSTGIRVSELSYITVEAVCCGRAEVSCKGKVRVVIMTKELTDHLKRYLKKQGIISGSIFITRSGKPLDRSNIWADMKGLCEKARVSRKKVFPHNLRHLFARVFYSINKDVARLSDILGHSSIETTRIYIMSNGSEHLKQLEKMQLIM